MKTSIIALALVSAGLFGACRQDMHDQPRYKAYGQSAFFADGRNMRPLVPGTVAQGHLMEDDHFYRGKVEELNGGAGFGGGGVAAESMAKQLIEAVGS